MIPMATRIVLWTSLCLLGLASASVAQEDWNGFDVSNLSVDRALLVKGGPPRDGIKSVDAPDFVAPDAADWVSGGNPVLGVGIGGEGHVYPLHLIERHQVVNDVVGGVPIVATFDPLTGAPRAWARKVGERVLEFGVAGLLWNHGFLLYDRETETLWSQFNGEAIGGPQVGARLRPVQMDQVRLDAWLSVHPGSVVLERPMPQKIDYRHSPFETYLVRDAAIYPVRASDDRFHQKELVVGTVVDGKARAFLGSVVTAAGGKVESQLAGHTIRIVYDTNDGLFAVNADPSVQVQESYWLAWKAFHPDTEVWEAPEADSP